MALVGRLQNLDLSRSCYPSYGAPTLTPVGLSPTGRASLRWTHSDSYRARLLSLKGRLPPVSGSGHPRLAHHHKSGGWYGRNQQFHGTARSVEQGQTRRAEGAP